MSNSVNRYSRGLVVVPSDAATQPEYTEFICLTAGNLVVTILSVVDGTETGAITIPLTAGQRIALTPKKITTATTGTYLGLIAV